MAIRGSISTNARPVENVYTGSPIGKINLKDRRGTADPRKNAYEGSRADQRGIPEEHARSFIMAVANESPDGIGVPKDHPVQDVLSFVRMGYNPGWGAEHTYRQRVRSPLTAIRGFCVVTCQSGSAKAVSNCGNVSCPFWAMRMGRNGHYGKKP